MDATTIVFFGWALAFILGNLSGRYVIPWLVDRWHGRTSAR